MEWKVKFDSYEQQGTMPLDRAKIEALRAIAEQLERLNNTLDSLIYEDEYTHRNILNITK